MLIEFSLANFRSFKDRQVLSLVASADKALRSRNVVAGAAPGIDVLRAAAVYGPNAAGKTTLFRALWALQLLVRHSASGLQQGQPLPEVVPFKLAADSLGKPSEFEIIFVASDGVRYQYGCALRPERVVKEWLIAYPQGRPQRWFERDYSGENPHWRFGPHFRGERAQRKTWQDSTRDNALFLSTAVLLNNEQLRPVFQWLAEQLIVVVANVEINKWLSFELLRSSEGQRRITDFLHAADIDIDRLELKEEDLPQPPPAPPGALQITFGIGPPPGVSLAGNKLYRVLSWHKRKDDALDTPFDLGEESDGTRMLFHYAGGLFRAIDTGATVCIDEFDRSLHPHITRFLLEQFQSAQLEKNPQLVFSTHDVTLLDQDLLRRDQVWFIEKDRQGTSRLYPLLDYSPRKDEALQRGYLKGRYGAVPVTKMS